MAARKTTSRSKKSTTSARKRSYKSIMGDLLNTVNSAAPSKRYEEDTAKMLGTHDGPKRRPAEEIISTGSLQLDIALGIGGILRGRLIEIAGFESAGKSSLALHTARNAQRANVPVLYIDNEHSLPDDYVSSIVEDPETFLVASGDDLESTINMIVDVLKSDVTKEANGILVVLDSIAATKSNIVFDSSADEHLRRGAEASRWAERLPVIIGLLKSTNSTMIAINQLRESQDAYTKAQGPGGSGLRFNYSAQIHVRKGTRKKSDRADGALEYTTSNFGIEKNKFGSPGKKGSFRLLTPELNDGKTGISDGREIWFGLSTSKGCPGYESSYLFMDSKFDKNGELVGTNGTVAFWLGDEASMNAVLKDDPEFDPDEYAFSIRHEKAVADWLDDHPTFCQLVYDDIIDHELDPWKFKESENDLVDEESEPEAEVEGDESEYEEDAESLDVSEESEDEGSDEESLEDEADDE